MNHDKITQNIITYGAQELIIGGRKRLCYLIKCDCCSLLHYKEEHELTRGLRRGKIFFCSEKCRSAHHSTSLKMNCVNCNKELIITPSQLAKSKSGNTFCSKSCAATYNNRHKKYGTRRSKLEYYIEEKIHTNFPNLKVDCNSISIIGSELDFYFPELKVAIQINGIFHFQPIYGQDRLEKIQKLDEEKRIKYAEFSIKLFEIDCSTDKYVNEERKFLRWEQVKNILEERTRIKRD